MGVVEDSVSGDPDRRTAAGLHAEPAGKTHRVAEHVDVARRIDELDATVLAAGDCEPVDRHPRLARHVEPIQEMAQLSLVRAGVAAAGVDIKTAAGDRNEALRWQRA